MVSLLNAGRTKSKIIIGTAKKWYCRDLIIETMTIHIDFKINNLPKTSLFRMQLL